MAHSRIRQRHAPPPSPQQTFTQSHYDAPIHPLSPPRSQSGSIYSLTCAEEEDDEDDDEDGGVDQTTTTITLSSPLHNHHNNHNSEPFFISRQSPPPSQNDNNDHYYHHQHQGNNANDRPIYSSSSTMESTTTTLFHHHHHPPIHPNRNKPPPYTSSSFDEWISLMLLKTARFFKWFSIIAILFFMLDGILVSNQPFYMKGILQQQKDGSTLRDRVLDNAINTAFAYLITLLLSQLTIRYHAYIRSALKTIYQTHKQYKAHIHSFKCRLFRPKKNNSRQNFDGNWLRSSYHAMNGFYRYGDSNHLQQQENNEYDNGVGMDCGYQKMHVYDSTHAFPNRIDHPPQQQPPPSSWKHKWDTFVLGSNNNNNHRGERIQSSSSMKKAR